MNNLRNILQDDSQIAISLYERVEFAIRYSLDEKVVDYVFNIIDTQTYSINEALYEKLN